MRRVQVVQVISYLNNLDLEFNISHHQFLPTN